jgi:ribosomal protein S6--L-glutamate ligase
MMPPGTLEQVVFRMDALHRVAAAGVPVVNPPRAIEAAVDKYLALARLGAEGLDVPETWVGESAAAALGAFEALGGDVVVKPLFGSEGRGLVRVSDRELARRAFQTLERLGAVLYVQRFLRHPGHDLRAFVLGGRVLGAIRRHAPPGDWRTNVAVGGRPEACRLDPGPSGSPCGPRAPSARRSRGSTCCPTPPAGSSSWRSTPCPAGAPWPRPPGSTSPRPSSRS